MFFHFRNTNSNILDPFLKDLVNMEKSLKEIIYSVDYDEYAKFNYIKEYGGDGMELIDKRIIDNYNKVVSFLLKGIGKNFLAGRDLTKTALPIIINDTRTMLDK